MDLADGSLITIAEAEKIQTVFTLDHKDFGIYRLAGSKRINLLPKKLIS